MCVDRTGFVRVHGGVGYGDMNSQEKEMLEHVVANILAIVNTVLRKSRKYYLKTYKFPKRFGSQE